MPEEDLHGNIYGFFPHPQTGAVDYDEDGDPILGWYWQIFDSAEKPVSIKMGPYSTPEAAEEACHEAWQTKDY